MSDEPADADGPVTLATEHPPEAGRVRPKKAPNAFRTISEVADELHIPQHVLRFWETKFNQVKPLKRGGGRRYYRPDDIALLRRISDLLYTQGYTIKGVQRLLREGGGRLSEDIPPASAAERAAAESEWAEAAVLQPDAGQGLEQPAYPLSDAAFTVPVTAATDGGAGPRESENAAAELRRLRTVLAETLAQLQALRALLP